MFEYFTPEFSGLRPSGLIIGGDKPPVYGRLGYPRIPPTMKAISDRIESSVIDDMIDTLYNISKFKHWTFHKDETLKVALETSLATQIIVFEVREKIVSSAQLIILHNMSKSSKSVQIRQNSYHNYIIAHIQNIQIRPNPSKFLSKRISNLYHYNFKLQESSQESIQNLKMYT